MAVQVYQLTDEGLIRNYSPSVSVSSVVKNENTLALNYSSRAENTMLKQMS